jgi:hypothetical protein
MLLAVAAKAAEGSSWWDEWGKVLPGWLAFLWVVGTAIRKVWLRQKKKAIGPDDAAVREALATARSLFNDIVAKRGCLTTWFKEEARRETGQRLVDLAARRDDEELKTALTNVAESWDDCAASAPPPRVRISAAGRPESEASRRTRLADQDLRRRQVESAQEGVRCVEAALTRLNKLERHIFGR